MDGDTGHGCRTTACIRHRDDGRIRPWSSSVLCPGAPRSESGTLALVRRVRGAYAVPPGIG